MEPIIAGSARRHGLSDESILHAFRNPVRVFARDPLDAMLVGPDAAGNLLEIGVVTSEEGVDVIVHAMNARPRFLS